MVNKVNHQVSKYLFPVLLMVIWLFESVHGLQHAYNMVIIYNPSYEPVTIHARGAEAQNTGRDRSW